LQQSKVASRWGPRSLGIINRLKSIISSTLASLFPSHLELAVMMAAAPGRHEAKLNRFFMPSGAAKMGSFD
jgi:hypothetical protein